MFEQIASIVIVEAHNRTRKLNDPDFGIVLKVIVPVSCDRNRCAACLQETLNKRRTFQGWNLIRQNED